MPWIFPLDTFLTGNIYVNTQEIEGTVRLNNNQQINVFDVIDLIWMPTYRWDRETECIIIELINIYNDLIVDEDLLEVLRKSLVLWAGKHVVNKNNIEKVKRGLKMSAQEVIDLERNIVAARIDGMLCRAEEAGRKTGRKEGREDGIAINKLETAKNMLDKGYSIEEIVEITGLSEKDILNNK